MKKKLLIAIDIFLILVAVKIIYNICINTIVISKYDEGKFLETPAKILTYVNFPQSYVAHYNYGNVLYKNGNFESAIEEYKEALKGYVPRKKECSIRINYALAICRTVQVNENDETSIRNAINTYEEAINVLTEEGCANKNDNNGHSRKAEQLKADIQKEIDRLKKLLNEEVPQEEPQEDEENNEKEDADTIEEKIQQIKEEAQQEQNDIDTLYEGFNKDFNYNDKNW